MHKNTEFVVLTDRRHQPLLEDLGGWRPVGLLATMRSRSHDIARQRFSSVRLLAFVLATRVHQQGIQLR